MKNTDIAKIIFDCKGKVQMDSRLVEAGEVFFAINSGNNYVTEVLKKNPALIIADKFFETTDKRIVFVENTVTTMQEVANIYRKMFPVKIIGITGSNGKTTTKDILFSVLSKKYKTKKTAGNYNNHIGLPFTILTTPPETEFLILEMGMSALGEIDLLCKVAEPDYGIITNIGLSHMEHLKTQENVFKAKTEMLPYVKPENMFIPIADAYLSKVNGVKVSISNFKEDVENISFEVDGEKYSIELNGLYNAVNSAIVIKLCKKIGLTKKEIQEGLDDCQLTPMRFQKLTWNGILLVNDAYNASPLSMNAGLVAFADITKNKYKVAVLGDMLELGDEEIKYHVEVLEKALELGYDEIIAFGPRMEKAANKINNQRIRICNDKNKIKEDLLNLVHTKKEKVSVFLKGSRGMRLEEIL